MKLILFIGRKRTGTSSIYNLLKLKNFSYLYSQESDELISSYEGILKKLRKEKIVVQVSPNYFSSFRAMYHCSLLKKEGVRIKIYSIIRENEEWRKSYLNYMFLKGEMKNNVLTKEFETFFQQNNSEFYINRWKKIANEYFIGSITSNAFKEEFQKDFSINIVDMPHSNKSEHSSTIVRFIFKKISNLLKKFGFQDLSESLSKINFLRALAYKKSNQRDKKKAQEFIKNIINFHDEL